MQKSRSGVYRVAVFQIILVLGIFISSVSPSRASVTLTNNSLSAFTSALANGGLINLAFNGTITATSTFQVISNTTLNAAGYNVTISGGNSNRVFTVATNITFSATNLIIAFGKTNGLNGGNGSTGGLQGNGNGATGGNGGGGTSAYGGAVFNQGTNYFVGCAFLTNSAIGGNGGAGGAGGNSSVGQGGDGGSGGGGGIGYGGAIYNLNVLVLSNCTFTGNIASGGNGGVGGTNGTPSSSTIYNGAGGVGASGAGAGLYSLATATVIVYGCTFNSNSVSAGNTQAQGGSYMGNGNGENGQNGGSALGGGVCNLSTNKTVIINCTFCTNSVMGGNGGAGERAGTGFTGGNGGNGGSGFGGNLYNSGNVFLTNCTFAAGSVYAGTGGAAGTGPDNGSAGSGGSASGANLYNIGTLNLKDTILAYPINDSDVAGTVTDQGNNLSSDTTPTFTQTNSFHNTDPLLMPLNTNGGPTLTFALQPASPAIGLADPTAAPGQDQRGYWYYGAPCTGSYEVDALPLPVVTLIAWGQSASEDGSVGLLSFERSAPGGPGPVVINYTISGSATNGVNYVLITNSITIPAGSYYTNLLIQAIPGSFSATNLEVTLAVTSNSMYAINPYQNVDTVTLYPVSTVNPSDIFVRGTTTAPEYQSFVIPLSSQTGVPLAASGGNATTLFPGNSWTTNFYHYNATNLNLQPGTNGRIVFQNPIVAFGSQIGGSPLYVNSTYQFGIYSGFAPSVRIQVYYQSNSALAGTINIPIPNIYSASQLTGFVDDGFTVTTNAFGLETTLFMSSDTYWGLDPDYLYSGNFTLTQTALTASTNYYYEVQASGVILNGEPMVCNSSGAQDWSRLYVVEFTPFPAGRSTFVDQPQFDGTPLPPAYQGMSLQELTNVVPTLPSLSSLVPSNYLTIDASPELRRHPILDQFVLNMNKDPLALANYVINEIDLTDGIDYDTNFNSQPAINLGGINRGALATYMEGQGSPAEQCALLIYLLRQAGVPAAYVYPANNGLQMLDFQVSKLLRVQLNGAQSETGQTNLPQLISVNYPWVAAYIGTNWVQIFPWMKDTEIVEGLDLYDYMPSNYNSGYKWMTHFIASDTNIFSLSTSDQPLDLLPLFIQKSLDSNYPTLSVDDMGVQIINRRHLYYAFNEFPLPFALSGTPTVIESLGTNTNLFNTLEILIYSQANTNKYIDTGEIPMLYFHDRKFLLEFAQTGSNLDLMSVYLSPYSTNVTGVATFGPGIDFTYQLQAAASSNLTSADDNVIFQVTHRRDKFLGTNYVGAGYSSSTNLWNYNYYEQGELGSSQTYVTTNTFRKGDWVAFCLDAGRVTQNMLNVWAQEIWQNPTSGITNIYVGTTAYLMGMSYFNYVDQFSAFNDPLHKVRTESQFEYGFGLIRPERTSAGVLTNNGAVIPITPALHMPDNGLSLVFNNSLRPDQGQDFNSVTLDWWLQKGVQGSAAEHGILEGYCQTNAVSSVKLLQQAGTNTVVLNALNYQSAATNLYHGVQLQNADTNLWAEVVSFFNTSDYNRQAFLTPGVLTNGTFVGEAGILFSEYQFIASVGGFNGGFIAQNYSPTTFVPGNANNITVNTAPDGSPAPFVLNTTSPVNNAADPVTGATSDDSLSSTATDLNNGTQALDPNLQQAGTNLSSLLGITNNAGAVFNQIYNNGVVANNVPNYADLSSLAAEPVDVMSGEFYIDAVDITLPGALNLQVRRNYSSQNQVENEFGFGWKINYVPYLALNTNGSLIYAAEMDGSVIGYRQTNLSYNVWVPTLSDNPLLNNNSSGGIGSVANAFNNVLRRLTISGTNIYELTGADGSIRTFITNSFPLGSLTRQRPYLTTWQDNRGNAYSFYYGTNSTQPDYGELNRIQSTSGSYVGFYYDVYGHIIQAYTGDGRILQYVYDKYGDLINVTLPDESQVNYVYLHTNMVTGGVTNIYSTHLMLQELKPNGRIVQNIYDSQRRVTNQMSTVGADLNPIRTATFVYTNNFNSSSPTNLLTGTTTIYDYTNHTTTYAYTNSLINVIVDPLGQRITQVWYGANTNGGYQRSLKSRTDKRGLVTTFLYDAYGDVTSKTLSGNLTGTNGTNDSATWTYTYNGNYLPLTAIDPNASTTSFTYDSTYVYLPHLISHVASNSYTFSDQTFSYTSTTDGTNTSYGLLSLTWRQGGTNFITGSANTNEYSSTAYGYNSRGFVTARTNYTSTVPYSTPSTNDFVTTFVYDTRGEMVQQTDAAGRFSTFEYDPMGRPASRETFEAGQTVPMDWIDWYYNENGELVWIDGPRYNPEDYVWRDYDGDGRKVQEIRWRSQANPNGSGVTAASGYNLYATSFFQYDPLGDMTQATDPLGNYVIQGFDAIGQMTSQTYYGSNGVALATNYFTHEAGGLVSSSINALGGITTNLYTSTGQLRFQQKPDGSTHSWTFDLTGRVVVETLANGSFWQTIYNDGLNRITNIFNNTNGPLATNVTQLDMRGNVLQSVDPYGNTWTNLYDGLNRVVLATGPASITVANVGLIPGTNFVTNVLQKFTAYLYDNCGKVLTTTNALGETTISTSDAIGRNIQVAIYNSNTTTPVRITSTVYSADHNSVTVTNGTGTSAIVTTTYTDTYGNPLLSLGYPNANAIEYTWWQYDLAGNRIAQQQCSSNASGITIWATNGWTYDGLNRVSTETSKDGATTTYNYDGLGDVLSRVMPGGLTWSATYTNDGRIVTEQEAGGSLTARSMSYAYYGSTSPFVGRLKTVTDARATIRTNTYDPFMRLAAVTTTGGTGQQQISTAYQYDLRNLLTNLTQTFASTNTGPATAVTRSYDAYGRILNEDVSVAGNTLCAMGQTWDVAGRRSQLNGVPFNYQADGLMIASDGSVYSYANNGLLVGRTNASRNYFVNGRDGVGRVQQATTSIGALNVLTENISWRDDGRITNYVALRGDFTDTRNYNYSALAQRLTQESLNVASGSSLTNNFTTDNGATGGLGILTSRAESGVATATWSVPSTTGLDGLSRVENSQNTLISRPAFGLAQGAGTVSATLDGNPLAVQFDGNGGGGQWRASLDMSSGSHTLSVSAVDPSGIYSSSSNSTFTVASGAVDTVTNAYDPNGNITQRTWINNLGQTNRIQTLTWDAFDRLIQETDQDTNNNGYIFTSIFDGLGRRVRTVETLVTNGVPITSPASSISTVDSWYDPQVEFLETAVNVNGIVTVKTYGPDSSGVYGGMQGMGGLESIYQTDHFRAVGSVQDYFGNIIGTITNSMVIWNPARFSSYGPVPGYQPSTLSLNNTLDQVVGWRGLHVDPDGNFRLGAREYSPVEGRFLSADPLGHSASMDLYSFCGGDPLNQCDPDGRDGFYRNQTSVTPVVLPYLYNPDFALRYEYSDITSTVFRQGYPQNGNLSPSDIAFNTAQAQAEAAAYQDSLGLSGRSWYPGSTLSGGATTSDGAFNGTPLYIDLSQAGQVANNAQIVADAQQTGKSQSQIQRYINNQPNEGEILFSDVPASGVLSQSGYIANGIGQAGTALGVALTAGRMYQAGQQSYQSGNPTIVIKQGVREAGGWSGAWAGARLTAGVIAIGGWETGPAYPFLIIGGSIGGAVVGSGVANTLVSGNGSTSYFSQDIDLLDPF